MLLRLSVLDLFLHRDPALRASRRSENTHGWDHGPKKVNPSPKFALKYERPSILHQFGRSRPTLRRKY
jgi:hypothetical protein